MTPIPDQQLTMTIQNRMKELQNEQKKLKGQSKQTSRLIGEAKKRNDPIDELKVIMLDLSGRLKIIADEIKSLKQPVSRPNETRPLPSTQEPISNTGNSNHVTRYPLSSLNKTSDITVGIYKGQMEDWNNYVANHAAATIYHRYEWQQILKRCYKLSGYYFAAHCNNKIVGVLPLTRHTSRLFGNFMVSMPWYGRGGAIADTPAIEAQLINAAVDFARKVAVDHIEFREEIARESLPSQTHKVNMVLDLPGSSEQLWDSFSSKLRAQIKRPQREKSSFLIGGVELMDDFYKVYARNMRDLGSPPHGKGFITQILWDFPDESRLAIVYLDNRPVGGGLLLGKDNTLEIPLASTIRQVNHLSMNMLLYWNILCYAIDRGYQCFDFGRSTRGAGTYRFKRQWGAEAKALHWNYWLHDNGSIPTINPANPKYQAIIWFWKRLPIWLANFIGSRVIRYIP
jgi:serine/alanine adding enzyme